VKVEGMVEEAVQEGHKEAANPSSTALTIMKDIFNFFLPLSNMSKMTSRYWGAAKSLLSVRRSSVLTGLFLQFHDILKL
jgi:hypothetical protein